MKRLTQPFAPLIVLFCGLMASVVACAAELPDFRDIVEKNSPAVVKIIVESTGESGRPWRGQDEIPEYLRRFFDFPEQPPSQRRSMGLGSGFIISRDGYIVTNNHVVEGATSVQVRLSDRREFEAEVVGTDPRSDLALLQIDADDLPVLDLAPDGELDVGEWVLAIGSPFGLDYSVTAGIVSAKGRSLPTEQGENYVPFIQTDVAINPGNSGGPLFNLKGEVVGVNSQIYTRSGGSIGLSFAIPVSVVHNVVDQLKRDGHVTRGWLGVTIQNVDRTLAESFGLDRPRGALVAQVAKGGPADKAGLEPGDVILRFDGKTVDSSADLPHIVGLIEPGTSVPVDLVRNQKQRTLKVKVGGLDADDSFSLTATGAREQQGGRFGLVVEDASAEMLERAGINGGVVVRQVVPDSAAAESGIVAGDVITMIGSTPVTDVSAFEKAVDKLKPGSSVPLRLLRRGAPMFIGLKLDK